MLKQTLFIFMALLLSGNVFGQADMPETMSLLKWLIAHEHITHLYPKTNAAAFYDQKVLKEFNLIDSSGKIIQNTNMQSFMSDNEVQVFDTVPPMLMQTDLRVKYSKLPVKFVGENTIPDNGKTIYSFSEPLFINDSKTRVIIGEYFVCGPACGRDNLLLCEYKNGLWRLIARAIIAND